MAALDVEEAWSGDRCQEGEAGTCLAWDGCGVGDLERIGIRPEVGGKPGRSTGAKGMARTVEWG
jgi:hypothetical protein